MDILEALSIRGKYAIGAGVNDELLESEDNNDISGDGVIKFNSKSIVVNNKEDK